jgi:hypothetical protein
MRVTSGSWVILRDQVLKVRKVDWPFAGHTSRASTTSGTRTSRRTIRTAQATARRVTLAMKPLMTDAVTRDAGTVTRDRSRSPGAGWGWSFAASNFNANGWMHSPEPDALALAAWSSSHSTS